MVAFQGIVFALFGLGVIAVALQSLSTGWLPCGSNFSKSQRFSRAGEPIRYWIMFVVYGGGGLALLVMSFRTFSGSMAVLPLN